MIILDGKNLSEKILENLKKEIKKKQLKLAVILVGDNSSSKVYIKEKQKACDEVGIDFELFNFPEDINQPELKEKIQEIVRDPKNSGIIIQLPLPKTFNTQEILNLIPISKDIDVLSEKSIDEFQKERLPIFSPTAKGIIRLLKEYNISFKGKNILLIGKGRLVGRPLALWFSKEKIDFSAVDRSVKDISSYTLKADIIISGTGSLNLIKGNMVKQGVIAVDTAASIKEGKAMGDFDFKDVSKKASYITSPIGGVGPMTVACLLENLIKLNI